MEYIYKIFELAYHHWILTLLFLIVVSPSLNASVNVKH